MNGVCVFDQLAAFNTWLKTLKLKEKKGWHKMSNYVIYYEVKQSWLNG